MEYIVELGIFALILYISMVAVPSGIEKLHCH